MASLDWFISFHETSDTFISDTLALQFYMREDKLCSFACKIDKLDISTVKNMMEKIDEDYHVNMYVEILFCYALYQPWYNI